MENRIKGVERVLERVDSARLVLLERKLQQDYDSILFQEELHWYQESRKGWACLGDRNTKYFHAQTKVRCHRSKINGLHLPGGAEWTDDSILQDEAQKFFKNLFCSSSRHTQAPFPIKGNPQLTPEIVSSLCEPVSKEEVTVALASMHPYKAHGLDSFQGIFFK